MRLAWRDRLSLLGDPEFVEVPVARLLSTDYARESADRITTAVKAAVPAGTASRPALSPAPFTSVPPIVRATLLR